MSCWATKNDRVAKKCIHKWKLLSETTTRPKMLGGMDYNGPASILVELTKRKLIQVFSCTKCGKIKKFVEDI